MRDINEAGLAIIKAGEALRLTAYQDPVGIWTIGWGSTPATPGTTITEAAAEALLKTDLAWACSAVDDVTHDVETGDNEFSAMASLTFNIGAGAFRGSSVLRFHRRGSKSAAADSFLLWDKAHVDGKIVALGALRVRRRQERALYLLA